MVDRIACRTGSVSVSFLFFPTYLCMFFTPVTNELSQQRLGVNLSRHAIAGVDVLTHIHRFICIPPWRVDKYAHETFHGFISSLEIF